MGPISCPETSVRNYQSTLRKIPDECISHLDGGGNPKSRKFILFSVIIKLLAFRLLLEITSRPVNPLNAELNPICHLLELLGAHHILRVSKIRVNETLGQNSACTNSTQPSVWNEFWLWNYTQRPSVWVIFACLNEWCVFINTEIICLNECYVVKLCTEISFRTQPMVETGWDPFNSLVPYKFTTSCYLPIKVPVSWHVFPTSS
jgi:hypothetical protein